MQYTSQKNCKAVRSNNIYVENLKLVTSEGAAGLNNSTTFLNHIY